MIFHVLQSCTFHILMQVILSVCQAFVVELQSDYCLQADTGFYMSFVICSRYTSHNIYCYGSLNVPFICTFTFYLLMYLCLFGIPIAS